MSEDERIQLDELKTEKTLEVALLDGYCKKKVCSIIEPYLKNANCFEVVLKVNKEKKILEAHVRESALKDGD